MPRRLESWGIDPDTHMLQCHVNGGYTEWQVTLDLEHPRFRDTLGDLASYGKAEAEGAREIEQLLTWASAV